MWIILFTIARLFLELTTTCRLYIKPFKQSFVGLLFYCIINTLIYFAQIVISGIMVKRYIRHLEELQKQKVKAIVDEIKQELKVEAQVTVNKFVNLGDIKER